MWKALDQQNVFTGPTSSPVSPSARPGRRARRPATKIHFLSHYVYTAPKNKVNDWLVKQMRKRSQAPDLFTPDGFVAAQMIVHALQKGDYDVDKMVSALEGYKFLGAEGLPGDPPAGPRDAAADVPGAAREGESNGRLVAEGARHRADVRRRRRPSSAMRASESDGTSA